ncbi:MAG: RNase adapter RapZ [Eubacterium sp.]|nr:RNase adapter RapZ [Eubacterium sp.]MDD7208671.1 RNase adapter RapZ [Lachnospiraceae bacterium]MDY5497113.1 RNase adapter RapZ [Anaerobutyricum sp.]
MRFLIVSGMSGAGKSTALKVLEDMGFFCVDNLPIALLPNFGEIAADRKTQVNQVAVVVDIRSGENLTHLTGQLDTLCELGIQYEILFLDAEDSVLVKRYKETRRTHPLAKEGRVETGIAREREMISFIKERADYIIDTTSLLTRELKRELDKIFVENKSYGNFIITVLSFGFKYGIPVDADLVFDVRFLPNPYYEQELRSLTGNDRPIQEYVMKNGDGRHFLDKLEDLMKFLIPRYIDEGKNSLVIGVGCTGGKHRSVTMANGLARRLEKLPYTVRMEHRDIEKDSRNRENSDKRR